MDDAQVMHAIELDDAYRVVSVLAHGATGTTELVTLGSSGPYVRKRIPLELANRAAWAAAMGANSPRVPRVVAMYEMPDQLVVVCEHVEGMPLERRMAEVRSLGWEEAVSIAINLCEAASALHAVGVIHRDISPKNVILASDGAHLIDLGIARTKAAGAPRDTTLLGTYGFAAPEQYGFAQSDERSDVYAIGRVLTYMLTGSTSDAIPAEQLPAPRGIQNAIRTATSFEPSARYSSANAFAVALANPDAPEQNSVPSVPARVINRLRSLSLVRKFAEATYLRKASAILVAFLFAGMVINAIQTIFARWSKLNFESRAEDGFFALLIVALFVVSGHQCVSAIVGAGGYEHEEHKVRRLVINLFIALMATSLLVVAFTRLI